MRNVRFLLGAAVVAAMPLMASAQIVYSDTFNGDTSADYNVYQTFNTTGGNTSSAVFGFDYSSLGIPAAPTNGLTDTGTTALRVQSDDTSATQNSGTPNYIIGAISVVTKGLTLPSQYKMSVEVWSNYVGGTSIADVNGSNSSTGATIGIGTAGTGVDYALTNGGSIGPYTNQGGVLVDNVRDATASGGTYRVYINGTNEGNTFPNNFYAAGTDATASQYSTSDAGGFYKNIFPSVSAPTAQSSVASTQSGSTPAGVFGFAWHNETLEQTGTNVIWSIDGNVIATIPDSAVTLFGGSQIALGDQDSNNGTGPTTYNFDLYENLMVTALPEPASVSMLGLGAMSLLARRRK